ncbi:BRO-N domain-containing protein, partial [Paenibacillus alvei]
MNQLQVFQYVGNEVRTVIKDGSPWFVLKDVVQVLGLSNSRMVKERLGDDVSSTYTIPDSLGRPQETTIINEDGLYDVILESRKPEARAFRKWITGDVIPTIRKTG